MSIRSFSNKVIRQIKILSPFSEFMGAFIVVGGLLLCLFSKVAIHLFINRYHSSYGDIFFTHATLLGDGISATLVVVVLLFINYRSAATLAVSNILCAVIIQSLKRTIFTDSIRPIQFFHGIHNLYVVSGVEIYSFNSFPSGHSATIFTTCAILSLKTDHKIVRACLLGAACLIAFSRVYLSQHFFEDIYTGAIIGFFVAVLTAAFFNQER
jgi:membrane-associated phospholipid phosphatase